MQYAGEARSRGRVIRAATIVFAALLGLAAVILIVFADNQKQIQIGVLLGLWAGLIAAFIAFGSRRVLAEVDAVRESLESQVADLREGQIELVKSNANHELQLRQQLEIVRPTEILDPVVLRTELNRLLTDQISSLRDEIAGLRADMVDKLGNQLRLERIETTRVVGSDLEALQREIRKLTQNDRTIEAAGTYPPPAYPTEHIVAQSAVSEPIEVEVVAEEPVTPAAEAQHPAPAPPVVDVQEPAPEPAPTPPVVEAPKPAPTPPVVDVPGPAPERAPTPPEVEAPKPVDDIFAGLPRLSRIPDDVAELLLPMLPTPAAPPQGAPTVEARPAPGNRPTYVGRRRAVDDEGDEDGGAESGESRGRRRTPEPRPARRGRR